VNSVNLVARVGSVSDLRASADGQLALRLRVVTDDSYVARSGERQTRANWHTVKVFDRVAEALSKRLVAGDLVSVQGRLVTWSAEGPNGTSERQEVEAFRVRTLAARKPRVEQDAEIAEDGR